MKKAMSVYLLGLANMYAMTPILAMEQQHAQVIHGVSPTEVAISDSPEQLNKLKVHALTSLKEQLTCRRCGEVGTVEKKYGCDHSYCADCVSNNKKNTCPVCSIRDRAKKEKQEVCQQCRKSGRLAKSYGCDHAYCETCQSKNEKKTCPLCSERGKNCLLCGHTVHDAEALACHHTFHKECVSGYMEHCEERAKEKNCPECRKLIPRRSESDYSAPLRTDFLEQVLAHEKCLYCYERFDKKEEIECLPCYEEKRLIWTWWGFFPTCSYVKVLQVNHYLHSRCLTKFICVSSVWNSSGQEVFKCHYHQKYHLSKQYLRIALKCDFVFELQPPFSEEERKKAIERESREAEDPTLL